jgi:sodium/potassium-transporting ATPase subunit beta
LTRDQVNMVSKGESIPTKVKEFQFHAIPKTTKWENFQRSLYDPAKQEFFGRTKKSWYQLLIFYSIFYACLAAFFATCIAGLLSTLDPKEPKWKLGESLIGTNPGLGFRPISNETQEGSLIWYDLADEKTTQKWVEHLDKFLEPYKVEQVGKNYQQCDYDRPVEEGKVCTVDLSAERFGLCTAENKYGYGSGSPCVFLKLNRIFGWVPEYHTEGLQEMPKDLRDEVNATNRTEVWISCEGEHSFDKERIGGFEYFPSRGFPGYYFPYTNNENYLSPLIAVQIKNVKPFAIVNIECRVWAKNVIYNGSNKNREGSVHFEVLVDNVLY